MTEFYFPFASIEGDRAYTDTDFATFYNNLFTNGVIASVLGALQVTVDDSPRMAVKVKSGAAIIQGRQYLLTEPKTLDLSVASNSQERTDSVVVRLNAVERLIELDVKTGTRSLVRNENYYEIKLAEVTVPRSASSIYSSHITDTRADSNVCGYSTPYEELPVTGLEAQYKEMLENLYDGFSKESTDEMNKLKSDFQRWFAQIRNEISSNQAANIQMKLNNLLPDTFTHEWIDEFHFADEGFVTARAFYWEYGLGTVGLDTQPSGISFDGTPPIDIPCRLEWWGEGHVKLYLPHSYSMRSPKVEKIDEGGSSIRYRLSEGVKVVDVKLRMYE